MADLIAITRDVSPSIAGCELTHLPRTPIDVERVRAQHAVYERALEAMGCHVTRLAATNGMPDSVFIEDVAVVFDEFAFVTRPGAASRRSEVDEVRVELSRHRDIAQMRPPATMDGGDVLVVGRSIFVGRTSRTNEEGIDQLRSVAEPFGYAVTAASVRGCLHLKSAVTAIDDRTLLANGQWAAVEHFPGLEIIEVDRSEPAGANIVSVGGELIYAAAFPRTRERLQRRGYSIALIDVSELAKAEGALTCCSLIFSRQDRRDVEVER